MKIHVGKFNLDDINSGRDKEEIAKKRATHPQLIYTLEKLVRKSKKIVAIELWICDRETYVKEGTI